MAWGTMHENWLRYVKKKTRYCEISFPSDTAIFRDLVLIYNWEESPKLIIIKSKKIANQYKKFFLDIWKSID